MDKEWVWKNRLTREYRLGVESFMQFAKQNVDDLNAMSCPCVSCGNLRTLKFDQVRAHLLRKGMDKLYTKWIWHGEGSTKISTKRDNDQEGQKNHISSSREPLNNVVHAAYESSEDSNEFVEKLEDDDKSQYLECTKFTKSPATEKLPDKYVLVYIDEAVDENAPLPVPTKDCHTIGDAVGSYVLWPKHLVNLRRPEKRNMEPKVRKPTLDRTSVPQQLYIVYCYSKVAGRNNITICLDIDVLGHERALYVTFEDIDAFSRLQPISTTCIVVYIRHLYSKLMQNKVHQFRFADPWYIECFPSTKEDNKYIYEQFERMACALTNRLIDIPSNQLLLMPCNVGGHWILAIINPNKEEVCLMDPLYHDNHNDVWRQAVDLVSKVIIAESRSRKTMKKIAWKVVEGPKSPDSHQCGFYVLRYMKELTEFHGRMNTNLMQSMFTKEYYSKAEIDEVRTEWAECLQTFIVDQ